RQQKHGTGIEQGVVTGCACISTARRVPSIDESERNSTRNISSKPVLRTAATIGDRDHQARRDAGERMDQLGVRDEQVRLQLSDERVRRNGQRRGGDTYPDANRLALATSTAQ